MIDNATARELMEISIKSKIEAYLDSLNVVYVSMNEKKSPMDYLRDFPQYTVLIFSDDERLLKVL